MKLLPLGAPVPVCSSPNAYKNRNVPKGIQDEVALLVLNLKDFACWKWLYQANPQIYHNSAQTLLVSSYDSIYINDML